jgi:hypothetical protein
METDLERIIRIGGDDGRKHQPRIHIGDLLASLQSMLTKLCKYQYRINIRWPSRYGSFVKITREYRGLHFSAMHNGHYYGAVHILDGEVKMYPGFDNCWRKEGITLP